MRMPTLFAVASLLHVFAWAGAVATLQAPEPGANANLGFRATSSVGDLTGDGRADFLLGAYRASASGIGEAGEVYLYSGRTAEVVETLQSPNAEFNGWFGHSVLGFDDTNSDGMPEIVVAADAETAGAQGAGHVYIIDGATLTVIRTLSSPNPSRFGQFGISIARVPDTTGDGVDELLVGAFREVFLGASESGRAYLFNGATGALLLTLEHPLDQTGTVFGVGVNGLDDLNGDGAGELLVGASGTDIENTFDAGAAFVFDGVTGDSLFTLNSPAPVASAFLGFNVAGVPDLTGDGIMDIAVGAHTDTGDDGVVTGRAHVFNGVTGAWLYAANPQPRENGQFGLWVDGIADVNGDSLGDILVGAQNVTSGCTELAGRAYLLDGATGDLLRTFDAPHPQVSGAFSFALTATQDANADGRPEVLAAAWNETVDEVPGAGRVYVFYSPLLEATNGGLVLNSCLESCAGAPDFDMDGDGLTACVETCLGTNDNLTDSDFDGMPDSYEANYGLDPLMDDSGDDPDGDGLTNLEEFLRNASPADATDPDLVVFVRPDGEDNPENGSLDRPWLTINYALSRITGTEAAPARIVVLCGDYQEDLALEPFTTLEGVPGNEATILGAIQGAEGARLRYLRVQNPKPGELLNISGTKMTVSDVTFAATAGRNASGIHVEGAVTGTVIERCTFSGLAAGLEISDDLPIVRRCIFEECGESGVLIHGTPEKTVSAKTLGDQTDPRTGWNTFRNNETFNLVNERDETISVQLNDWNTNDAEAIANSISGKSTFEPFLEMGKGILASSIFCTVWDGDTQERIENASVAIAPGGYIPVTENIDGVYTFPALPGGSYTLTVTASGYPDGKADVFLADTETLSVTIPLGGDGAAVGGCNCNPGNKGAPARGDMLPALFVVLALLSANRRSRKK